ncbi:MAG: MlaD family protein [Chitinivibrionia bacterium]|nr:MlaD family protein [Chitinivibrionia bacterium]
MKKKRSDLLVGIVILAALVLLIAGIMWLKAFSITQKMVTYTAVFSNIGGLQVGDPVAVNGLKKGSVSGIELYGSLVAVHFKLDSEVPFTDSAIVAVKNVGLMGERKVEISLSDKGKRWEPNYGKRVRQYIKGNFDSGIAEAIGMLGDFMADASALVDSVSVLLDATLNSPEFKDFYDRTVVRLDTIVEVVDRLLKNNDEKVDQIVGSLKTTTKNLDAIVVQNKSGINNIVGNADSLTNRAADLMLDLDSLLADLKSITSKIDAGSGSVGQLINDSTTVDELMATVAKLDTLLNEVRDDGLRLRVKLGFGEKKKKKTENKK